MTARMRELVQFVLEAHNKSIKWLKAGAAACNIARQYHELFEKQGYARNFLYGPCHGLGMMEVEPPWMEETSDYILVENMTFQVDSFCYEERFGLRWENGGVVTTKGFDLFGGKFRRLIEIN